MAVSSASLLRPALLACACVLLAPPALAEATPSVPRPAPATAAGPAPTAKSPDLTAPGPTASPSSAEHATPGLEEEPEGLGWMLTRTVLLFGAVLASIYLTLNVGLRKLMGLQGVPTGRPSVVSVVERVPLDQRRTLFVLKAAGEYLLVGGGEGGLQMLSKLDTEAVERIRNERPPAPVIQLSPFLQKLLARRNATQSGATSQPGGTQPPGA